MGFGEVPPRHIPARARPAWRRPGCRRRTRPEAFKTFVAFKDGGDEQNALVADAKKRRGQ